MISECKSCIAGVLKFLVWHKIQALTSNLWCYNDTLWWEKKNPNKPNKSPNWKALHYKFSFFYKFSLTSGDLPSLYWVSMNKLRRQVACWIRSIYKANLKLFQQSCSDACGAWYSLCWSQRYIHISGRL